MNADSYPRGLFLLAALSVAALSIVAADALTQKYAQQTPETPRILAAPTPSPYLLETDEDGDGMPDWQEELAGMDPKSPDSVRVESEPLPVKTAADAVGTRMVEQYLFLKDAQSFTQERGERLGTSLAENLFVDVPFSPFQPSATRRVEASDASVERYRSSMQAALSPLFSFPEPEFAVYARYVHNKDQSALQELARRGAVYEEVAEALMAIAVPDTIYKEHTEAANGLAFFGAVLREMHTRAEDPLASLALLRTYTDAERYIEQTFAPLNSFYETWL